MSGNFNRNRRKYYLILFITVFDGFKAYIGTMYHRLGNYYDAIFPGKSTDFVRSQLENKSFDIELTGTLDWQLN